MWCSQDTTLCVKPETTKFLEENRCSFLPDIGLSNIYIYILDLFPFRQGKQKQK